MTAAPRSLWVETQENRTGRSRMTAMSKRRGLLLVIHRLHLLASAWRLHGAAQRLAENESLPTTQKAMLDQTFLPVGTEPQDALWAARWVARARRRLLGQLDTCLVRSLVAGALVADGPDVAVRIGVHRPQLNGDLLDAHAWLTIADREISPGQEAGERFEEVLILPMERA